jgi:hypothetical protein
VITRILGGGCGSNRAAIRCEPERGVSISGWQSDSDDFDIKEFEAQEDRMIELACYLLTREKDRLGGKLE